MIHGCSIYCDLCNRSQKWTTGSPEGWGTVTINSDGYRDMRQVCPKCTSMMMDAMKRAEHQRMYVNEVMWG